jgi:glycosyltransferase EpsJ
MKNKLISIILPYFNDGNTIIQCLNSIFLQSYEHIELILINDGSSDNSQELINNYLQFNNRFTVQQLTQVNKGAGSARNFGISHASGEFIVFVDADDFIGKDYIKSLFNNIAINKADFSIAGHTLIRGNKLTTVDISTSFINDRNKINHFLCTFFHNGLLHGPVSKIYRSDILKTNRITFPDFRRSQDIFFNIDYVTHARSISTVNNHDYHIVIKNQNLKIKQKKDKKQLIFMNDYYLIISHLFNKFDKLFNNNSFEKNDQLLVYQRIYSMTISQIFYLSESLSYSSFLKELRKIVKSQYFVELNKTRFKKGLLLFTASFLLYWRFYFVFFLFSKFRTKFLIHSK